MITQLMTRKYSEETRKRMSESALRRWETPTLSSELSQFKLTHGLYHDTSRINRLTPQTVRIPDNQFLEGRRFEYEPLGDTMVDDGQFEFEAEDTNIELKHQLNKILSKRELVIITRYYGLDGEEPSTLVELSDLLDLTRERVRSIRDKALKKLRYSLNVELL